MFMLLLTSNQVTFCSVKDHPTAAPSPGIEYHRQFYSQIREYPASERHRALHHCRYLLDQGIYCLVVQDAKEISLWISKPQIQRTASPDPLVVRYRGAKEKLTYQDATISANESKRSLARPPIKEIASPAFYRGQFIRPAQG